METPWGNLEVADAHVHFLSWNFYSILARQKGEGTVVEALLESLAIPLSSGGSGRPSWTGAAFRGPA
jgi:hypothetical protein